MRPVLLHSAVLAVVLSLALAMPSAAREAARGSELSAGAEKQAVSEPRPRWTAGPASSDCTRARRKLWQPGEGWLVKTITICR